MPTTPRWTHVALPVNDISASVAWYESFTPLRALDVRRDGDGDAAWLGHPEPTDTPFILVLVSFDATKGTPQRQLGPFGHLGIELPTKAEVDAVAEQARAAGCLEWEPAWWPPPVGYVCSALDPDANLVEFSFQQGVEDKVHEVWGRPTEQ
ncbi:MAG: VOC family protein [Ilumatobacteraceae bacterium]